MSDFNRFKYFGEIELPTADRQQWIKLFKDEGLTDTQISNLIMAWRRVENPEGLNEIIFEISGKRIVGDYWDKDIQINSYIGRLSENSAKRKVQELWGKTMEKSAYQYLENNLKDSGWLLQKGEIINGIEFDCLGWLGAIRDKKHLDLVIEMTFPMPKGSEKYGFEFLSERVRKYRAKMRMLNAMYSYVLIGIPRNKTVTFLEVPHLRMSLKLQGHKFGNLNIVKRPSTNTKDN